MYKHPTSGEYFRRFGKRHERCTNTCPMSQELENRVIFARSLLPRAASPLWPDQVAGSLPSRPCVVPSWALGTSEFSACDESQLDCIAELAAANSTPSVILAPEVQALEEIAQKRARAITARPGDSLRRRARRELSDTAPLVVPRAVPQQDERTAKVVRPPMTARRPRRAMVAGVAIIAICFASSVAICVATVLHPNIAGAWLQDLAHWVGLPIVSLAAAIVLGLLSLMLLLAAWCAMGCTGSYCSCTQPAQNKPRLAHPIQ